MARDVTLGFTADRERVLAAIYRMGVGVCEYSHTTWSPKCDCKYGVAEAPEWPMNREQNGCPELRSLYGVINVMTDEEWSVLVARAGGVPNRSLAKLFLGETHAS